MKRQKVNVDHLNIGQEEEMSEKGELEEVQEVERERNKSQR